MNIGRIDDQQEIVKVSKDISKGDKLLVNRRKGYLEVEEQYEYYKDSDSIKEFFILRGNGTKYLFVVYRRSPPLIYTNSNFELKQKDYTSGYGFKTANKSSERVRRLFVSTPGYCDDCSCTKLHDSIKDEFYCPLCEV